MSDYKELKKAIDEAKKIVVFTGAGISCPPPTSIPDFRSANGLYSERVGNVSPEEIISHSFFMAHPEEFFEFYGNKMVYKNAKYNKAHKFFADLEKSHDVTIVTQNIDGLHQAAGSTKVYELHGSVRRNYCMRCHKYYDVDTIDVCHVPYCECGGIIKPDVVLGMGGYASGPGGIAAWLSHIPLVLHEQNAAAGVTNRILANFATVVCLGFPNNLARKKSDVVGNPIRDEISAIAQFPIECINDRRIRVLVVGGSLGAQVFNETLPPVLAKYK